jgi:dihydrofolate reductase
MMVSIIAAMAKNRVIGNKNALPWHIPEDFKWFKQITMGKPIIMGKKTFESIGKPLPGRKNIILSRNKDFQATECMVFDDIKKVLNTFSAEREIVIIGGAQIYEYTFPLVRKMYLTIIEKNIIGDTYFPAYDLEQWKCISEDPLENMDKYPFRCKHKIYVRIG